MLDALLPSGLNLLELAVRRWDKASDRMAQNLLMQHYLARDLRFVLDLCSTLLTKTVQEQEHREGMVYLLGQLRLPMCENLEAAGANFAQYFKESDFDLDDQRLAQVKVESAGKPREIPLTAIELFEKIQSKCHQLRLIAQAGLASNSKLRIRTRVENLNLLSYELKKIIS